MSNDHHGNNCKCEKIVTEIGAEMTSRKLCVVIGSVAIIIILALVIIILYLFRQLRRERNKKHKAIAYCCNEVLLANKEKCSCTPEPSEPSRSVSSQTSLVPNTPAHYTPRTPDPVRVLNKLETVWNYGNGGSELGSTPKSGYHWDTSDWVGLEYQDNDQHYISKSITDTPEYGELLQDSVYELPSNLNIHPDHYLPNYKSPGQSLGDNDWTNDYSNRNGGAEWKTPRPEKSVRRNNQESIQLRPAKDSMTPGSTKNGYLKCKPLSQISLIGDRAVTAGLTSNISSPGTPSMCEIKDSGDL